MHNAKGKVWDAQGVPLRYVEVAETEAGQSEAQKAQGPDNINYH